MRVAYICQSYPPMVSGAALVVQRLAAGVAARGHEVLVAAASSQGRAYTELDGDVRLAWLRSFRNPARVGQRFMLWPRGAISRVLRAFRPDVMHLHDPTSAGLAALLTARAMNRPAALTVHQLPWAVTAYVPDLPGIRRGLEAALWAYGGWFSRECKAVVTPSRIIADVMGARGPRPEVISNGVDLSHFSPRPSSPGEADTLRRKYTLDSDLPIVLHIGRIDADKNVDAVVLAAARALRSIQGQLLVVGDGTQLAHVMRLTEELGISKVSRFPGFVNAMEDLPGLYRLASVFVTASEVEIQSSVVLEAAATGRVVIAVRASSMSEFIEDGISGWLVPPGDVGAMADRIVASMRNREQSRAMGQAALDMARRHSLEHSILAHERLYQSLIWRPSTD